MRKRTMLVAALSLTPFWYFVPVSRAQYCDFPSKEFTQGEHRKYRGPYENRAYGYSVAIPANLVGYDDANPFYRHGFGVLIGTEQPSYIFVNGEPNSLEFVRPSDAASHALEYLRKNESKVETSKITDTRVDQLNGAFLIVTYTCPRSTEHYVRSSMFAISPDKSKLYEVTLYAYLGRLEQDRPIFDAIVRSWKYLPQNPGEPSSANSLPAGVLRKLRAVERQYCEDQFGDKFKKGCDKKFEAHLKWLEVSVSPTGQTAILIENQNLGFCGSAGCALYLFVQQADASFVQVLGSEGDVGTLKRLTVLKKITNGHYDIQKTWADGKTHTIYRWNSSQYSPD